MNSNFKVQKNKPIQFCDVEIKVSQNQKQYWSLEKDLCIDSEIKHKSKVYKIEEKKQDIQSNNFP